jgi:hypothetical protein
VGALEKTLRWMLKFADIRWGSDYRYREAGEAALPYL